MASILARASCSGAGDMPLPHRVSTIYNSYQKAVASKTTSHWFWISGADAHRKRQEQ
jgi:hypothetical protein